MYFHIAPDETHLTLEFQGQHEIGPHLTPHIESLRGSGGIMLSAVVEIRL